MSLNISQIHKMSYVFLHIAHFIFLQRFNYLFLMFFKTSDATVSIIGITSFNINSPPFNELDSY